MLKWSNVGNRRLSGWRTWLALLLVLILVQGTALTIQAQEQGEEEPTSPPIQVEEELNEPAPEPGEAEDEESIDIEDEEMPVPGDPGEEIEIGEPGEEGRPTRGERPGEVVPEEEAPGVQEPVVAPVETEAEAEEGPLPPAAELRDEEGAALGEVNLTPTGRGRLIIELSAQGFNPTTEQLLLVDRAMCDARAFDGRVGNVLVDLSGVRMFQDLDTLVSATSVEEGALGQQGAVQAQEVALDELAGNVDEFTNQMVAVTGDIRGVAQAFGAPVVFTLGQQAIPVVVSEPTGFSPDVVQRGARVQATGEVLRFDVRLLEQRLGVDLPDEALAQFEDTPLILANPDAVQLAGATDRVEEEEVPGLGVDEEAIVDEETELLDEEEQEGVIDEDAAGMEAEQGTGLPQGTQELGAEEEDPLVDQAGAEPAAEQTDVQTGIGEEPANEYFGVISEFDMDELFDEDGVALIVREGRGPESGVIACAVISQPTAEGAVTPERDVQGAAEAEEAPEAEAVQGQEAVEAAPRDAEAPATLAEVVANPEEFTGDNVAVLGRVGEILGQRAFRITEGGDEIAVLTPSALRRELQEGERLQVSGFVRIFDRADIETLGVNVSDDVAEALEGEPVIVANRILAGR